MQGAARISASGGPYRACQSVRIFSASHNHIQRSTRESLLGYVLFWIKSQSHRLLAREKGHKFRPLKITNVNFDTTPHQLTLVLSDSTERFRDVRLFLFVNARSSILSLRRVLTRFIQAFGPCCFSVSSTYCPAALTICSQMKPFPFRRPSRFCFRQPYVSKSVFFPRAARYPSQRPSGNAFLQS